jgi:dolichol-phosphate mannosyltransferase
VSAGVALSAVLPTYNESRNILPLLERLEASLAHLAHEIVVVDDDSPDGTARLVEAFAASHPAVRLVKRVGVRGLRSAIQEGIDRSSGAATVWMDCDLSMPPERTADLHRALESADVAVGSRYAAGGADARTDVPLHRAFSRVLNLFIRALLGAQCSDYTSGFVCAKRTVLDEIRLAGHYGEYCIDFLHRARKRGFRIVEVPYENVPRAHGESKTASGALGLLTRGWPYVLATVRLRMTLGR